MLLVIFRWKYYYGSIMDRVSIPNRPGSLRPHRGRTGTSVGASSVSGAMLCGRGAWPCTWASFQISLRMLWYYKFWQKNNDNCHYRNATRLPGFEQCFLSQNGYYVFSASCRIRIFEKRLRIHEVACILVKVGKTFRTDIFEGRSRCKIT